MTEPEETAGPWWDRLGEALQARHKSPRWKRSRVDRWVLLRIVSLVVFLGAEALTRSLGWGAPAGFVVVAVGSIFAVVFLADIVTYHLSLALSGGAPPNRLRLLLLTFASYFTIGLAFAQLFVLQRNEFPRDSLSPAVDVMDLVYFSFVTLGGIGYGDIHPALGAGLLQATVVMEHLIGLFFVAVALVVVVGMTRDVRPPRIDG